MFCLSNFHHPDVLKHYCFLLATTLSFVASSIFKSYNLLNRRSKLFFSKTEIAAPHGMIDLSKCMTVKSAEVRYEKQTPQN